MFPRITLFFQCGNYGWSESYVGTAAYGTGMGMAGAKAVLMTFLQSFIDDVWPFRYQLLGGAGDATDVPFGGCSFSAPTLIWVRVGFVCSGGIWDRYTVSYNPGSGGFNDLPSFGSSVVGAGDMAADPRLAVRYGVSAGLGTHTRFLHGIPDDWIAQGCLIEVSGAGLIAGTSATNIALIQAFLVSLTTSDFLALGIFSGEGDGNSYPIQSISCAEGCAGSATIIEVNEDLTADFETCQTYPVTIKGMKMGACGKTLRGRFTGSIGLAGTGVSEIYIPVRCDPNWGSSLCMGSITITQNCAVPPIDNAWIEGVSTRRLGRPFGSPPGRRSRSQMCRI